jgi:CHAD domain-containing protein
MRTRSISYSQSLSRCAMGKRWRIKPNKNLRENARLVVPIMIDEFLAHSDRVVNHPRLKLELHRMRLAGKTLRYAMEVFHPAFGDEFEACLEEVKRLLDAMGRIHDCDVNVPRLQAHVREVRLFNRTAMTSQDKVSTGAMVQLIHEQFTLRHTLFQEMATILEQWSRENFKGKILQSMMVSS